MQLRSVVAEKVSEYKMTKWIIIGIGLIAFIALMIWGVDGAMCKEAMC